MCRSFSTGPRNGLSAKIEEQLTGLNNHPTLVMPHSADVESAFEMKVRRHDELVSVWRRSNG